MRIFTILVILIGGWLIYSGWKTLNKEPVDPDNPTPVPEDENQEPEKFPIEYNFFDAYGMCIRPPSNEGSCHADWTFSAVGALSHRFCKRVADLGFFMPDINKESGWLEGAAYRWSVQTALSCLTTLSDATCSCEGGDQLHTLNWLNHSFVPFTKCTGYDPLSVTPENTMCSTLTDFNAFDDKYKLCVEDMGLSIRSFNWVDSDENFMKQIITNGPVTAYIKIWESFFDKDTGGEFIYQRYNPETKRLSPYTKFRENNGLFVQIVGWGQSAKKTKQIYWDSEKGENIEVEDYTLFWIFEESRGDIYQSYGTETAAGNSAMARIIRYRPTSSIFLSTECYLFKGNVVQEGEVDQIAYNCNRNEFNVGIAGIPVFRDVKTLQKIEITPSVLENQKFIKFKEVSDPDPLPIENDMSPGYTWNMILATKAQQACKDRLVTICNDPGSSRYPPAAAECKIFAQELTAANCDKHVREICKAEPQLQDCKT